jgi:protein JSN1
VPSRFTNPLEDFAGLTLQQKHASSSVDVTTAHMVGNVPPVTVNPPTRSTHPSYQPPPPPNSSSAAARLRSGSLTLPNALYPTPSTPFGPAIFSSSYLSRVGRSPSSPAYSAYGKDEEHTPVKTLDYLGLADAPITPPRRRMAGSASMDMQQSNGMNQRQEPEPIPGYLSAAARSRESSRIRSYSVADKDKYDEDHTEYDDDEEPQVLAHSTYLHEVQTTPKSHFSTLFAEAHSPRPRASTTGVINSPPSLTADIFGGPIHRVMEPKMSRMAQYSHEQTSQGQQHQISREEQQTYYQSYATSTEDISSQPSRALWLATVPPGVTAQHLETIFGQYGVVESTRILSHKNCGFVNYHTIEDAVSARVALTGRELFHGSGAVKIGFAKEPSGILLSPSPEPLLNASGSTLHHLSTQRVEGTRSRSPAMPPLRAIQPELMQILSDFGAGEEELRGATEFLHRAGSYTAYRMEIPPMPEVSPQRIYDAPKLRDIRKRIDNGTCSPEEIEHIAIDMLPEIAELSSDYLGNTVVQKLFENCSEGTKTRMLIEIAPFLASIGVHKNGTWAAQKIIDVANTEDQVPRQWGVLT